MQCLLQKAFWIMEDVKANFSKFGSKYIGHPNNKLPGIEMNSGSSGTWTSGLRWNGTGRKDGSKDLPRLYGNG